MTDTGQDSDTRDPRVVLMRWVDERIADARDELWAEMEDRIDQGLGQAMNQVSEALAELRQYIDAQDAYMMGRIDMVGTMFRDEIERAKAKHPAGKPKAKKVSGERLADPHEGHVD